VAPINNQVNFNTTLKLSGQVLWNADARLFLEKKVSNRRNVELADC
jgi:hypothetical protein